MAHPELTDELTRRAAVHGALGDPVRLAIVDELVRSDRAPSELAARFGLSSNLLAHHLAVLERVGLVERTVSSGDRRRRYVRLVTAALPSPTGVVGRAPAPRAALFVCTHNSARSQLAAAMWRRAAGGNAASAGTHPAERVHPGAVAAARRRGLDLSGAVPRRISPEDLDRADLVVTVCDRAHEEIALPDTALHWSIPDPVGGVGTVHGGDPFDAAASRIEERILAVANLTPQEATP